MDDNTNEGKRFCTFYKVTTAPTIAIIDPRTGECVKTWTGYVDKETLIGHRKSTFFSFLVQKFAETNQYTPIQEKPMTFENVQKPHELDFDDEMDEDEMMRLAIEASLQTVQQQPSESDKPITKPDVESTINKKPEPKKIEYMKDFDKYIVKENSTRVQLRFESGKREVINLSLKAPLSALYAIYHDKLSEEEKNKKFTVIFMNEHLENSDTVTLEDKNIKNASLSILFDDE